MDSWPHSCVWHLARFSRCVWSRWPLVACKSSYSFLTDKHACLFFFSLGEFAGLKWKPSSATHYLCDLVQFPSLLQASVFGYSLDLECPPSSCVLKAWLPVWGATGRWDGNLQKLGSSGRKLGHVSVPLKGIWWPCPSSLSLLFGHHGVNRFLLPHASSVMCCLIIGPKQ